MYAEIEFFAPGVATISISPSLSMSPVAPPWNKLLGPGKIIFLYVFF